MHLCGFDTILGMWLTDCPRKILPLFYETAYAFTLEIFPAYEEIQRRAIFVRFYAIPITDSLRNIRQNHLDTLVSSVPQGTPMSLRLVCSA